MRYYPRRCRAPFRAPPCAAVNPIHYTYNDNVRYMLKYDNPYFHNYCCYCRNPPTGLTPRSGRVWRVILLGYAARLPARLLAPHLGLHASSVLLDYAALARQADGDVPAKLRASVLRRHNEHGNDFVFYSAFEPDSLIAVLWHFFLGGGILIYELFNKRSDMAFGCL